MPDDCVQFSNGGCTPRVHGDDTSFDCCERAAHGTPGVPEYRMTVVNPDEGVTSSGGVLTVI